MQNEYSNTGTTSEKTQKEKSEWWIPLGCILLVIALLGFIAGYIICIIAFIILEPIERYQEKKKKRKLPSKIPPLDDDEFLPIINSSSSEKLPNKKLKQNK